MTVRSIENTDRAKNGLSNFHYALIKSDTRADLTYGDMVDLPNTISIEVTVNNITNTLYADNKPVITYASVGTADVTINRTTVPQEVLAELLGSPRDGAVRYVTPGVPAPYVGIAYQNHFNDGFMQFVKLYKGRFQEPAMSSATSTDAVEFQTDTIVATFIPTTYQQEFTLTGPDGTTTLKRNLPLFLSTADETDPDYTNEGDDWFKNMFVKKP